MGAGRIDLIRRSFHNCQQIRFYPAIPLFADPGLYRLARSGVLDFADLSVFCMKDSFVGEFDVLDLSPDRITFSHKAPVRF
jgi:hypothetical protein